MENLNEALRLTGTGLVVVFSVMLLIAFSTWVSGRVFQHLEERDKEKKRRAKEAKKAAKQAAKEAKAKAAADTPDAADSDAADSDDATKSEDKGDES